MDPIKQEDQYTFDDVCTRCNVLACKVGVSAARNIILGVFGTDSSVLVELMSPDKWGEFIRITEGLEAGNVSTERIRPPLTWADPKPTDRFPGFTVKKSAHRQEKSSGYSPDLSPTGTRPDFRCGSAHLIGGGK